MLEALKNHWPEYLIEAWGLGTFMVSACVFGVLLFHPDSALAGFSFETRNILMGVAMGTTAILIFCSAWGKRSGAHINPAVTLAFVRLGKIKPADAVYYVIAQFAGAILGVLVSWIFLGEPLAHSAVNFVPTLPGGGIAAAFAAEAVIAFFMMITVLMTGNHRKLSRFTPFLAGLLIALFISIESPVSGMSINPARTFGSAIVGNIWTGWWIYFIAPPIAMLAAAELYLRAKGLNP